MNINLNDLLAKATVNSSALVKRPIEWKRQGENGELITDNFDVFIVSDISFAASDRIYLGDNTDSSRQIRSIVERIRLGEEGTERLTIEQASNLEQNLGWALFSAILAFDKERAPKDLEDAKS